MKPTDPNRDKAAYSHLILGQPMVWKFLFRKQKPLLDLDVDPLSRRWLRKAQSIQQLSGVIRTGSHDLLYEARLRLDVHDGDWLDRGWARAADEMGVSEVKMKRKLYVC